MKGRGDQESPHMQGKEGLDWAVSRDAQEQGSVEQALCARWLCDVVWRLAIFALGTIDDGARIIFLEAKESRAK